MTKQNILRTYPRASAATAFAGALSGTMAGVIAGPSGAMAGGILGFLIGALAGAALARTTDDANAYDRELERWSDDRSDDGPLR